MVFRPRRSLERQCGGRFRLTVKLKSFVALRARASAVRRSLVRQCGGQQGGAGYRATPDNLMPSTAMRVWAAIGGITAGRKVTDLRR